MSARESISPSELTTKPFELLNSQWLLLACGDFEKKDFNMMTIAWGSMGTMWHMPFIMTVVRPQRHTLKFMEKYDNFTLSAFPEKYENTLTVLGTRSGMDMDKINSSGLTPTSSPHISSPSFEEAELVIECEKIYTDIFKPENIIPEGLNEKIYPAGDHHHIFFGKVLSIEKSPASVMPF
ncbi:MAG: hypothetical protein A2020_02470 [Lentisphaerae bacterium GWF2_45_14]|nr:MAG: hypothetical protein A2020_02470 [Lentisphaerae bacterium GWF2_45_14]